MTTRQHQVVNHCLECVLASTHSRGTRPQRIAEVALQHAHHRLRLRTLGERFALLRAGQFPLHPAAIMSGGRFARRRGAAHACADQRSHELAPVLRGWVAYHRLSEVKSALETLEQWIRRKLRVIIWRQWKRRRTRAARLIEAGLDRERAHASAAIGRGPWWNAARHMTKPCPPKRWKRWDC